MIYLNVLIKVKDPATVARVRELLIQQGEHSRKEPGCVRFEIYHSNTDPTRFVLNEHWASQADLDQHRLAYAYTNIYAPLVLPLVDREGHPCQLVE